MQADTSSGRLTERPGRPSEDSFPPQTSRAAEVDALIEMLRGVLKKRSAIYVSAPITSGRRFVECYAHRRPGSPLEYQRDHVREVIAPNRSAAVALVNRARETASGVVIDPTAVGEIEGWTQGVFRSAWARVIEEFARAVVFANGWEFSNGCCYEFLIATKSGLEMLDESWCPIDVQRAISLIRAGIDELSSRSLPAEFLHGIVEELASLNGGTVSGRQADQWLTDVGVFKDAALDSLANHGNVAQFVSFSPTLRFATQESQRILLTYLSNPFEMPSRRF
jgi:hypothetical protein